MAARRRSTINKKTRVGEAKSVRPYQEAGPSVGRDQLPAQAVGARSGEAALPLAVILKIMGLEYQGDIQGEALCRAALRLAEECGVLDQYRAVWDAEEESSSGRLSGLLFSRRQSLDLVRYYEKNRDNQSLLREKERLNQIEGRLLLGGTGTTHQSITQNDLDLLEDFIKESGF